MKIVIIVLIFVLLAVLAMAVFNGTSIAAKYKARSLLTENEAEFLGRLVAALPEHYIFPQVAMSALIEATATDKKIAHSDRLRIAQQRVDYVVCDLTCKVLVVVELDDRTHSPAKDQKRDDRLRQAGIRTVRFQSKNKPAIDAIRAAIIPAPVQPSAEPSAA